MSYATRPLAQWLGLTIVALASIASPSRAAPEDAAQAERFSRQFASFCLQGESDLDGFDRRARQLGAAPDTDLPTVAQAGLIEIRFWRGQDTSGLFILAASVSDQTTSHLRIVGCQASTQKIPANHIISALSRLPELGPPNDNDSPSLIRRDAGWFMTLAKHPAWVSVSDFTESPLRGPVTVGVTVHLPLPSQQP